MNTRQVQINGENLQTQGSLQSNLANLSHNRTFQTIKGHSKLNNSCWTQQWKWESLRRCKLKRRKIQTNGKNRWRHGLTISAGRQNESTTQRTGHLARVAQRQSPHLSNSGTSATRARCTLHKDYLNCLNTSQNSSGV